MHRTDTHHPLCSSAAQAHPRLVPNEDGQQDPLQQEPKALEEDQVSSSFDILRRDNRTQLITITFSPYSHQAQLVIGES